MNDPENASDLPIREHIVSPPIPWTPDIPPYESMALLSASALYFQETIGTNEQAEVQLTDEDCIAISNIVNIGDAVMRHADNLGIDHHTHEVEIIIPLNEQGKLN